MEPHLCTECQAPFEPESVVIGPYSDHVGDHKTTTDLCRACIDKHRQAPDPIPITSDLARSVLRDSNWGAP